MKCINMIIKLYERKIDMTAHTKMIVYVYLVTRPFNFPSDFLLFAP